MKIRSPWLLTGAVVLATTVFAGGCSTIQGAIEGAKGGFSSLDRNDDGVISVQEASVDKALSKSFQRADTNQDGNINAREYDAAHAMIADVDFQRLDFNDDGVISRREIDSARPSLRSSFKTVDSDQDKNVSVNEYRAATINLMADTDFASIDEDGDGVIDRKEGRRNSALEAMFSGIDVDQDGMVSRTEFRRAQSKQAGTK